MTGYIFFHLQLWILSFQTWKIFSVVQVSMRSFVRCLKKPEKGDRRKCIRGHIRMVMEQLEEILNELKEVARELREVLNQIDNLTSYIDLETEEDTQGDKRTMSWSKNSNERVLGNLLNAEAYSDRNGLSHLLDSSLCGSAKIKGPGIYRHSCGDVSALNGPSWSNASWLFGRREEMVLHDKVEHHALCCDDDDFDEESGSRRSSRFSSNDSVFLSSPLRPWKFEPSTPNSVHKYHLGKDLKKKALRSCSTQTVSDKSTQTALPLSPARERAASEHNPY